MPLEKWIDKVLTFFLGDLNPPDKRLLADVARRIGIVGGTMTIGELSGRVRGIQVFISAGARSSSVRAVDPIKGRGPLVRGSPDAEEIERMTMRAVADAEKTVAYWCDNATRGTQMLVRRQGVRQLGLIRADDRTPAVRDQLERSAKDENASVRLSALIALDDPSKAASLSTDWLVRLMKEEDLETAIEGARGLALAGTPAHLAVLNATKASRPPMAFACELAIARIQARAGSAAGSVSVVAPDATGALSEPAITGALSKPKP